MPEDVADGRVNRARPREQRTLGRAVEMAERIGLRCPIEIPERSGEAIEMVLGPVVVASDHEISDCRFQIADLNGRLNCEDFKLDRYSSA